MKTYKPEEIKEIRETLNMDKVQFANSVGVGRQTVSYWENGTRVPQVASVYAINKLIGDVLEKVCNLSGKYLL